MATIKVESKSREVLTDPSHPLATGFQEPSYLVPLPLVVHTNVQYLGLWQSLAELTGLRSTGSDVSQERHPQSPCLPHP